MAAMLIGRDYSTVKRWLRIYRHQGIGKLLQLNSGGGKSLSLSPEIWDVLEKQLQQPQGFDFEKKALRLSRMAVLYSYQPKRYWCTEESRFGLKTVTRRRLTPRGVKPNGQVQWSFPSYYLYGLVEPLTGENFFLECSHLNTNCFEAYLQEFSQIYPHELHIIPLDKARFHTAKRLIIPDNI